MERRRTLGSEVEEMSDKEWKLIRKITASDAPNSNNELIINTDNDGNAFAIDEIYMRITNNERVAASYNTIGIGKNLNIGELRGNVPHEVFIKNIAGIWRLFYFSYNGAYNGTTLQSWGAFYQSYIKTLENSEKIKEIRIGNVSSMDAEIYGR